MRLHTYHTYIHFSLFSQLCPSQWGHGSGCSEWTGPRSAPPNVHRAVGEHLGNIGSESLNHSRAEVQEGKDILNYLDARSLSVLMPMHKRKKP